MVGARAGLHHRTRRRLVDLRTSPNWARESQRCVVLLGSVMASWKTSCPDPRRWSSSAPPHADVLPRATTTRSPRRREESIPSLQRMRGLAAFGAMKILRVGPAPLTLVSSGRWSGLFEGIGLMCTDGLPLCRSANILS
jgi:hypothetical protein